MEIAALPSVLPTTIHIEPRNLDHGVCSGLILLQALLFVRELFLGFQSTNKKEYSDFEKAQTNPKTSKPVPYQMVSKETFDNIRNGIVVEPKRITIRYPNGEFKIDDWFSKVCWATSSAAIHSLIQLPDYRKECQKHILINENLPEDKKENLKIDLKDDSLAFLGILVDKLQEWDRYKVRIRGASAFTGEEPLQSTQIKLDHIGSKITMTYPAKLKDDLCKEINDCLKIGDLKGVVEIIPSSPKAISKNEYTQSAGFLFIFKE